MPSRVNEVNGESFQDPPIKNPDYANASDVADRNAGGKSSKLEVDGEPVGLCYYSVLCTHVRTDRRTTRRHNATSRAAEARTSTVSRCR